MGLKLLFANCILKKELRYKDLEISKIRNQYLHLFHCDKRGRFPEKNTLRWSSDEERVGRRMEVR